MITPLQQLPDEPTAYRRPIMTQRAPERLNLLCIKDMYTDKGHHLSYHMTARRVIPEKAKPAIIDELTNLIKKGVLTGRDWGDLTHSQRL